jgi:hypothetical protein
VIFAMAGDLSSSGLSRREGQCIAFDACRPTLGSLVVDLCPRTASECFLSFDSVPSTGLANEITARDFRYEFPVEFPPLGSTHLSLAATSPSIRCTELHQATKGDAHPRSPSTPE